MFMSDERAVRFKMVVANENCERKDVRFWIEKAPTEKTYKLEFLKEYNGTLLDESHLKEHGFLGGNSIQTPCCNNSILIEYIDTIFNSEL